MSVTFNGTDSLLEYAGNLTGGVYPFAVFAWFRPRGATLTDGEKHEIAGSGKWGAGSEFSLISLSSTNVSAFERNGSGSGSAQATRALSDTWFCALAVFTSADHRNIFCSGGASVYNGSSSTAYAAGAHDRFRIGVRPHLNGEFWEGDIAEVAVWSGTVPDSTDFTSLAGGTAPEAIKSASLQFHATLLTHTALGVTTGPSLTTGGTLATGATHPISRSSAATAVTLTGPTSGTVGVASTDFTVGADGTITGDVVVTPSDGGDGGTFFPTSVTINSGSPTGTFTYTAANAGSPTASISVTNDGGLTNPSAIDYSASAPADPPVITSQPSNTTVKRGQTATFTLAATGSGTVTYQWQRNPGGVGSWADISGATSASYTTPATTISDGSANDQDDYRCQVSDDDAGPVASDVVTLTVQQCVLALNASGYEFGDGNAPATMAVLASTELQVAAYPLTEWPPASAVATATATTASNGRLADLGDDDLVFGTTYRVIARNAADGETWAWTMAAS